MRWFFSLAALIALPAYADLYRWVDPQTGSVKFSSYPTPWFGDQALRRAQEVGIVETLRRGLEAQFGTTFTPKPPAKR